MLGCWESLCKSLVLPLSFPDLHCHAFESWLACSHLCLQYPHGSSKRVTLGLASSLRGQRTLCDLHESRCEGVLHSISQHCCRDPALIENEVLLWFPFWGLFQQLNCKSINISRRATLLPCRYSH